MIVTNIVSLRFILEIYHTIVLYFKKGLPLLPESTKIQPIHKKYTPCPITKTTTKKIFYMMAIKLKRQTIVRYKRSNNLER